MVRIRPKHGVRDVLLGAKDNPGQRSGENGTLSDRVRLEMDTSEYCLPIPQEKMPYCVFVRRVRHFATNSNFPFCRGMLSLSW